MRLLWGFLFIFNISIGNAQLHGVQWLLGFHESVLDFRNDTIVNYSIQPLIGITLTNANICDENGDFLYFTNGISIFDRNGDLVQNGDSLNPCPYTDYYSQDGLNIQQAALFLPMPGNMRYYYLFHFSNDALQETRPGTLYYSIIDKEGNSGFGAVIEKNVVYYRSTFREGGMTACKHANGRDWWIVMGGTGNNRYNVFLLTPNGITDTLTQYIGPDYNGPDDIAYSKFSMDGSKYVTVDFEGYITVMDFDRCSGQFSNPVTIYNNASSDPINHPMSGGVSVEFSSKGRFVYVSDVTNVNQYDLQAANIQDSVRVYTADSSDFYQIDMIQLAPNGKIYGSTWNGGGYFLHVINKPDELGDSCGFEDRGIVTLTANTENLPNMVNYILGPLVGSGCDTILSISSPTLETDVKVYPNPAKDFINLKYFAETTGSVEFEIFDQLGNVVMKKSLGANQSYAQYSTEILSSGIYYWRLRDSQRTIKTDKVAIIK